LLLYLRVCAFELGVLGFVNNAHATFAELFKDFVM
jgi:hypothetical protein